MMTPSMAGTDGRNPLLPVASSGRRPAHRSNLVPGVTANASLQPETHHDAYRDPRSPDVSRARCGPDRDRASVSPAAPARNFAPGELVFEVGERHAPSWLVLKGSIDVVRRDGLDREAAITRLGRGQFSGEVNQLAGPRNARRGSRRPARLHRAALRRRPCARADDRLRRGRRDRHAGVHPTPRRTARGGRRGLGAARPAGSAGSRAACRIFSAATAIPTPCSMPPMTRTAAPWWSVSASCRTSCR